MQAYHDTVQDQNGNIMPTAQITVTDTSNNAVTVYSNNSLSFPITQPFTPNTYGQFTFYAPDGRYTIHVTYNSVSYTLQDVLLEDILAQEPFAALAGSASQTFQVATATTGTMAPQLQQFTASSGASNVGFIQSGTGAVARTLQSKEREIISVTDFYANGVSGAMVDPTGVIDSTAGIKAAHDAAKAAGGATSFGCVNFPAGIYKFTSFTWSPHVEAHAIGNVILTTALASGIAIHITNSAGNANIAYRNKTFSGNFFIRNTNTSNTSTGFYIGDVPPSTTYTAAYCTFDSLSISGFLNAHTYGNNAYLCNWVNCYFAPASVAGSAAFIKQTEALTNSGENLNYISCVIDNFSIAIDITIAGIELNIIGGSIDYNDIVLGNTASNSIIRLNGVHIEWNNTTNTQFYANGVALSIIDPYFIYTAGSSTATAFIANVGGTNGNCTVVNPTYNIGVDIPYYYIATATAKLKINKYARQFGTNPTTLVNNVGAGTSIQFVDTEDFAQSIAAAGYLKMPYDPTAGAAKKLIYQWGTIPNTAIGINASVTSTVTFPIAFTTAVFHAGMSTQPDGTADFYGCTQRVITGTPLTTTQFVVRNGATAQNFINNTWFAIGY